jgi:hypothetical protein
MTAVEFMKSMVSSLERNECYIRQTIVPPTFQSDLEIEDTFDSDFSVNSTSGIDDDSVSVYSVAVFTFSDIPSIGFALMMSNWTFIEIATALIEMGYHKLFTKTILSVKLYGYKCSVQNILNDIVFSNNGVALDKLLEVDYYEEYKDVEYVKNRLVNKSMLEISERMIDLMINKFPDSTNCIPILLRYKHDKFGSTKEDIGL